MHSDLIDEDLPPDCDASNGGTRVKPVSAT
jgi:hypothetical protein